MAKTKDLLECVSLSFVRLQNLNIQRGGEKPGRIEVAREYNLDIISISEHSLRIGLDLQAFCRPDGPFKLDMKIMGEYEFTVKQDFGTDDVTPHIETLAGPLFARASLIAAFITNEAIATPIIFPPFGDPEE